MHDFQKWLMIWGGVNMSILYAYFVFHYLDYLSCVLYRSKIISLFSAQLVDDQKCSTPTDESIITSDKQKKKLEKELKSKQKEIAKAEKKEKEKEEKEERRKEKEEKKKEKAEKNQKARNNMKANSVQGQPVMEDFR